jgi:hypothetical protein
VSVSIGMRAESVSQYSGRGQSVLECEPSQSVSIPAEWLQLVVSWESRVYSEAAVFREELQVNRSHGVGRRATSEDTVRRLGKYYSELRVVKCIHCNCV